MQTTVNIPDGRVFDKVLIALIWDMIEPQVQQAMRYWDKTPELRIDKPTLYHIYKTTYKYPTFPNDNSVDYTVVFRSAKHRASKLHIKKYLNTNNLPEIEISSYNWARVDQETGYLYE